VCLAGYYGPTCNNNCPSSGQVVCSGHGTCSDGIAGTGECTCDGAHRGTACELACPTSIASVACSAHGSCSAVGKAAVCACLSDDTLGHWAGADCSQCFTSTMPPTQYAGASCTVFCPVGPSGDVCNGAQFGMCDPASGTCVCATGSCGRACERSA